MLIEFSVTNFLSIKERQTFSTIATSDDLHEATNLISFKNKRYSKINVFYGANASGKSNFFRALGFARWIVFNSNSLLENFTVPVIPFAFDEETKKQESTFEFIFVKNGTKYFYSFSCDSTTVYSEHLEIYENNKPKLIFNRSNISNYTFTSYKNDLEELTKKNTRNKLFLCTSANWNFEPTKAVVEFLINDLCVQDTVSFDQSIILPNLEKITADGDMENYKKFCLNLLACGDFSITDFDIEIRSKEISEFPIEMQPIVNAIKALPTSSNDPFKEINLTTYHTIFQNGTPKKLSLKLKYESLGTQALFKYAPILFDVLKNGKVLVIDEIDRSLHPLLVHALIELFVSETNTSNAQIICNTHDTNLLDFAIFRRDEIWFVERDPNSGVSVIYPLTDFSPRKNENIEKGYLLGRYGAIPFIRPVGDLWEK